MGWGLGLALCAGTALAQTHSLERRDPSRGATLPPTSTALADEATALQLNPGGLASVGGLQLLYAHERSIGRDQLVDGLYLADTLGPLGLGLSVEWVRFTLGGPEALANADYRKTGWGLSLGNRLFALGATWNLFASGRDPRLDALSGIDLGLLTRPSRHLSVGAVVRNVDERSKAGLTFTRRIELGVGVRPFDERLTLAADWILPDDFEVRASTLSYTLQVNPWSGLQVGAGLAHAVQGDTNLRFQLSGSVSLGQVGVTYAGGHGDAGDDHVALLRLSSQAYPAVGARPRVALLDLGDLLTKSSNPALSLLGARAPDPYLELHQLLVACERDPRLAGVVLKLDSLPEVGWGKVEELRQAMLRLRGAGKKVIAVVQSGGDLELLLASAADKVLVVPQGMLLVNGLSASVTYVGGTMEKLGVHWDVAKVGAYKNAPDQLTRKDMSPEQREAIDAYLDAQARYYEEAVAHTRKLSKEKLTAVFAEGLLLPPRAVELGLVDAVLNPQELEAKLHEELPGAQFDPAYSPWPERQTGWGRRDRIAIVPVIGNIAGGKSREDPLGLASIAGAETVVRALEEAAADPAVKAIVVRVDSGGGDGLASDLMYRAVLEAKKKKPVVASMGDVAASGGYYAAMGADEVFALPTTLTGSIGVFLLKPAFGPLAQRLGMHRELISRAPLADIFSVYQPWNPAERAAAEKWVAGFYDDFITEVARSRKLEKDKVDAVARGRIWSGGDAKARGLVDTLGGLHDAVASARTRAGLEDSQVELQVMGSPAGLLATMGGEEGVRTLGEALLPTPPPAQALLPEALRQVLLDAGLPSLTALEPGPRAQLPFQLSVR